VTVERGKRQDRVLSWLGVLRDQEIAAGRNDDGSHLTLDLDSELTTVLEVVHDPRGRILPEDAMLVFPPHHGERLKSCLAIGASAGVNRAQEDEPVVVAEVVGVFVCH
jgi:hypothetical protein